MRLQDLIREIQNRPKAKNKNRPIKKQPDGCWNWLGSKSRGYGYLNFKGKLYLAHRFFYERLKGPIPPGLTLDHLCRNRSCCNPRHLEPVTSGENVLRGESWAGINSRKTHCKKGHPFNKENTYHRKTGRGCRICRLKAVNKYNKRRAA